MAIKTVDMDLLAKLSGNIFQSVAILAKRSRQISKNTKSELDDKLAYFEGFEQELEDPRFQEEQARVSLEYEVRSEASEMAIDEMVDGQIYCYRFLGSEKKRLGIDNVKRHCRSCDYNNDGNKILVSFKQ